MHWDDQAEVVKVLEAMKPYLIVKKPQVDFFLAEYVPTMKDRKGTYHLSYEEHLRRLAVKSGLEKLREVEFPVGIQ